MNFVIDYLITNPRVCLALVVGGLSLLLVRVMRERLEEWETEEHERAQRSRLFLVEGD